MTRQLPDQIVDVAEWSLDPDFPTYPEGSRSKDSVFSPDTPPHDFIVPQHRYLFKRSNPNFIAQFWVEIIGYIVGQHMGVSVPPAYVAVNSRTGDVAALIEWFYGYKKRPRTKSQGNRHSFAHRLLQSLSRKLLGQGPSISDGAARYVPGSNYMVRLIPGYDLKTGRQHNVKTLASVANLVAPFVGMHAPYTHWAKVFIFDALIGNTDRHQDNWGLLWYGGPENLDVEFSPVFDNGTALGHEILEGDLVKFSDPERVDRYIQRGTHHIRWRMDDPKRIQHVELIRQFVETYRTRLNLEEACTVLDFDFDALESDIRGLQDFDTPVRFTVERGDFVMKLLRQRYGRIREALN